tara:strand:+ start:315 stop:536 length:222 start_codon:yes stop_codon:yes gene_type:complete
MSQPLFHDIMDTIGHFDTLDTLEASVCGLGHIDFKLLAFEQRFKSNFEIFLQENFFEIATKTSRSSSNLNQIK